MESRLASLKVGIRNRMVFALVAIATLLVPAELRAGTPPKIDGIWDGNIEVGQDKTPLTIYISSGASGQLSVLMDMPNSNAWNVPAISSRLDGTNLSFSFDTNRFNI